MKKKFNVSFKNQPKETGLAGVGHPYPTVDIKVNKKVVGCIHPPNWSSKEHKWIVRIMVKEKQENCDWTWKQIKTKFDNEEEARIWVKENLKILAEQIELHSED